jgi:hypothetical protein
LNSEVFQFRASFQFLSQPDRLGPSACPSIAGAIPIFDGDLPPLQPASAVSLPVAEVATQPGELIVQLSCPSLENCADLLAEPQKFID